jgi:NRAMP (natural resistance-associated macrophage protein)-like metal ion transporter
VASDVPEVLGTAFALQLLFGIPLWIGVLITAADTMLFLLLQYISVRILEVIIALFLFLISACFIVEMFWAKPNYISLMEVQFWQTLHQPLTIFSY